MADRAGLSEAGEWVDPLRKLDEVVYLAEWPSVLTGRIDQRFLDLPERVVITAMQSHQRYFPVRTEGRLEPRFLFVANGGDPETVIRGNEEVLVGRLTDAEFAFASDVDRGIEAMAAELDRVSFLEGSGSIAEKTLRVRELAAAAVRAAASWDRQRRRQRCAPPSSQGRPGLEPGRRVLRSRGVRRRGCTRAGPESTSRPQPRSRSITCRTASPAPLPASDAGAALSIADKADTLAVAFRLGLEPTGSRDPYGLRRTAAGLVAVALDRGWRVGLTELVGDRCGAVRVGSGGEPSCSSDGVTVEEVRAARGSGEVEPVAVACDGTGVARAAGPQRDALRDVYGRSRRIAGEARRRGRARAADAGRLRSGSTKRSSRPMRRISRARRLDAPRGARGRRRSGRRRSTGFSIRCW